MHHGIPVLPVTGKGDLPLFRDFLHALGIQTFVLTDVDAITDTVPKLCDSSEIRSARAKLLTRARHLVETGKCRPRINKKYAERLATRYRWSRVFDNLECLHAALMGDDSPTEEQIACLEKLLLEREADAMTQALRSQDAEIQTCLASLTELLLEESILVLRGTIEDYYPGASQSDKVKSALEFDPLACSRLSLCSCFVPILGGTTTDMEAFLSCVFET